MASQLDGLELLEKLSVHLFSQGRHGNFQRRRVHRFSPVTAKRFRLTVTATYGDPSARVFGIRLYDEARPAPEN